MLPKRNTPPGKGGARDSLVGWPRFADKLKGSRAQCFMLAIRFGPELLVLLALLVIGGAP